MVQKETNTSKPYLFCKSILEVVVLIVDEDSNIFQLCMGQCSILGQMSGSLFEFECQILPEAKRAENFQKVLKAMGLV